MIKTSDYCASEYIKTIGKPYLRKKGTLMSLDRRIDRIYTWYPSHEAEARTYLLAAPVAQRLSKMDTSKLNADAILCLANNHKNECGVILDAVGQPVKISCTFLIQEDAIMIEVFNGSFASAQTIRYTNGHTDYSSINKCFVGSVVVSSLGIEKIANNPLELLKTGVNFRVEEYYATALKRVLRETSSVKMRPKKTVSDFIKEHPYEAKFTKVYYEDLQAKHAALEYALRAFLYIHCSDSIKADYISETELNAKSNPKCIRNYILIDSLWDTEVNVLNPFSVSGHFTHQPYGKGRALRKLIYIDSYMKNGYHRKPGKELIKK